MKVHHFNPGVQKPKKPRNNWALRQGDGIIDFYKSLQSLRGFNQGPTSLSVLVTREHERTIAVIMTTRIIGTNIY